MIIDINIASLGAALVKSIWTVPERLLEKADAYIKH